MLYIFYTNAYKKIFCEKHYWTLIFEQGTKQPYVICRDCKHKEKVYWYSSIQRQEILKGV